MLKIQLNNCRIINTVGVHVTATKHINIVDTKNLVLNSS